MDAEIGVKPLTGILDVIPLPVGHNRVVEWFIRWRRWILLVIAAGTLALELNEPIPNQIDFLHPIEIGMTLLVLIGLNLSFNLLLKAICEKARLAELLNRKHTLGLKLASIQEWDGLMRGIIQSAASIVQPEYACLLVNDTGMTRLELAAEWFPEGVTANPPANLDQAALCQGCRSGLLGKYQPLSKCKLRQGNFAGLQPNEHCLALIYGSRLVGLIFFQLSPGKALSPGQEDLLNNLWPEYTAAIHNAQQRRLLTQLSRAEAALQERAAVSRDLHDTLSQNLGYLHLKLDQGLAGGGPKNLPWSKADLIKMRDAADEAYQMVRGTLRTLRANQSPLTHLLQDQFAGLAEQNNIDYRFYEEGQPRPLPAEALHQIFYIYREAVSNVTRHSAARHIEAALIWEPAGLSIRICDDGQGFDPASVEHNQSFGLAIMKERVEALNGRLDLHSSPGAGTQVTVWLPQV
jgi:signal transduction histidine kinase